MSDETQITPSDNQAENAAPEASAKSAGKSNLMKYLMFGGGGLVAVVLIVVITLMVAGGGDENAAAPETTEAVEAADSHAEEPVAHSEAAPAQSNHRAEAAAAATSHSQEIEEEPDYEALAAAALAGDDSLMAALENDPSVLDNIMSTLDYLDYVPEEEEMGAESEASMTAEDSVEKVKWYVERETAVKAREDAVSKRARELDVLEKRVNQKILRLEQAESSRVTQLARLYDGMEARAVARLAANLDDNTVVAILPRMKPKNASAVLSLMPAKRAAKLSKQLITIAEN